jgi:hypothetical protein
VFGLNNHPIEGLMTTAMQNIKEMVDVNTILGDPVETMDGSVIIPISKVTFGFAAGGSEFEMIKGMPKERIEIRKLPKQANCRLAAEAAPGLRFTRLLFWWWAKIKQSFSQSKAMFWLTVFWSPLRC